MHLIKFLIIFLTSSVYSAQKKKLTKKDKTENTKNQNKYLINQIKRKFKEEFELYFKTYHHGHDLSKADQIKIGDDEKTVQKLLGPPIKIKELPDVNYYVSQTNKKRFGFVFFQSGTMLRIQFTKQKNGKKVVKTISKTPLKKSSPSISFNKLQPTLDKEIKSLKIEL